MSQGEVFTTDDAKGLADFATSKGLGRVSTWSLNRDTPCSTSFADVMVLSNTCSSVDPGPAGIRQGLRRSPRSRPPDCRRPASVTVTAQQQTVDDPAKSPYPIWRPEAQYVEGYKVVRHGLVYQAKWYTQGEEPTMAVGNPWDTPWSLVGPIGPDDKPFVPKTLAPGTYPEWSPQTLYAKGDKVLLEGLPYEARWPNQGEVPSTLLPVGPGLGVEPPVHGPRRACLVVEPQRSSVSLHSGVLFVQMVTVHIGRLPRRRSHGKIVVTEFISLDGVIDTPSWTVPYQHDDSIEAYKKDELFASDACCSAERRTRCSPLCGRPSPTTSALPLG